ncbi:hypothetical protein CEP51_007931 [Fusarium floridanum]|uniref:Uncharacterized protein n=1 Tax=Fusarium floridanum TaxID=1325733 RepID=A0A428RMK0_9HYPO|nr:hypothetical protein CEP51_007931 [Fusarium floridanum]
MATENNSDTDQNMDLPMYAIRDVPGKGKGLVATKPIPTGTRILTESPLLTSSIHQLPEVKAAFIDQVNKLPAAEKVAFLDMALIQVDEPDHPYWARFLVNCMEGPEREIRCVYMTASRINHSCVSNAYHGWNGTLNKLTIQAIKDIAEGEEITICYFNKHKDRASRHDSLVTFTCTCSLCSLQGQRLVESDKRLGMASKLYELVTNWTELNPDSALRWLHAIRTCIDMLTKEGVAVFHTGYLYSIAFKALVQVGDAARGKIMLDRHIEANTFLLGRDHPKVEEGWRKLRIFMLGELQAFLFGINTLSFPTQLEGEAFENWLWKDERACRNGPADLSNETIFPRFADLPILPVESPDYYHLSSDGRTYRPRKNWCILAEITRVSTAGGYFWLLVQDRQHTLYSISFESGGQNSNALKPKPQVGWTVALMYPKREGILMGGELRHLLRVTEQGKDLVKIFQVSMGSLMALNARAQHFSIRHANGARTCHGCERKGTSLKACARCSLFWYCNKDCQARGWRDKTHKHDCKLLKDPDLKAMFHTDWDNMGERMLNFPLAAHVG